MKKSHVLLIGITIVAIIMIALYFIESNDTPLWASFYLSIGTGLFTSGIISIFIDLNSKYMEKNKLKNNYLELSKRIYKKICTQYQNFFECINYNQLKHKKNKTIITIKDRENIENVISSLQQIKDYPRIKDEITLMIKNIVECQEDWDLLVDYYLKDKCDSKIEFQRTFNWFKDNGSIDHRGLSLVVKELLTLFANVFAYLHIINSNLSDSTNLMEQTIIDKYGSTSS